MDNPFLLDIIRGIAMTQFRPMGDNDYAYLAGAAPNSVIAHTGGDNWLLLKGLLAHPKCPNTLDTEENSISIVVCPPTQDPPEVACCEIIARDADGVDFVLNLQLECRT